GGVSATNSSNGFQQEIRTRRISAELQSNPERACCGDKSYKCQTGKIAIDTDAARNGLVQFIRGHLPYRMMHPMWRPRRILNQNPKHNDGKERSRKPNLLDCHRVALASDQQRSLVDRYQARKQNGIYTPGTQCVAAEPEWTPCERRDKRP